MNPLILASSSEYKIELMRRLRLPFESEKSTINEGLPQIESPQDRAGRLALLKARDVFSRNLHATVIGADQVIALETKGETRIYSKPITAEKAFEQLRSLSGKTHSLYCGISVVRKNFESTKIVRFEMEMRDLDDEEIERYIAIDHPFYCSGSYKIESFGIDLFRRLEGPDYTAIIGLPLTTLRGLLESSGYYS